MLAAQWFQISLNNSMCLIHLSDLLLRWMPSHGTETCALVSVNLFVICTWRHKICLFVESVKIVPNSPHCFASLVHQATSLLVIQHFTPRIFLGSIHIFKLYLIYFDKPLKLIACFGLDDWNLMYLSELNMSRVLKVVFVHTWKKKIWMDL